MSESDSPEPLIDPVERSITVGGRIVIIRQERAVWEAFDEICQREDASPESLVERVESRPGEAALDVKVVDFVTRYYKDAVSQDPPRRGGMAEGDGGAPKFSPAALAALDAIGPAPEDES